MSKVRYQDIVCHDPPLPKRTLSAVYCRVWEGTSCCTLLRALPVARVRPHLAALVCSEASLGVFPTISDFLYFFFQAFIKAIFSSHILTDIVLSVRLMMGGTSSLELLLPLCGRWPGPLRVPVTAFPDWVNSSLGHLIFLDLLLCFASYTFSNKFLENYV